MIPKDTLELMIYEALKDRNIEFTMSNSARLDFYLPNSDLYIEVKRMHSQRVDEQMKRVPNVIVIQGIGAVAAFANLIKNGIFR